jgi:hypothetical protein
MLPPSATNHSGGAPADDPGFELTTTGDTAVFIDG